MKGTRHLNTIYHTHVCVLPLTTQIQNTEMGGVCHNTEMGEVCENTEMGEVCENTEMGQVCQNTVGEWAC